MSKTQKQLKLICLSAMMAAIFVVLDYFSDSVSIILGPNRKISFNSVPILIVAILCGPLWGSITGFVGSLISQWLMYGIDPTTIFWMLPWMVEGLLVGLIFIAFKRKLSVWSLGTCAISGAIIVTIFNTVGLIAQYYIYGIGKGLYAIIIVGTPVRLLMGVLTAVIITAILPLIIYPLKKATKL